MKFSVTISATGSDPDGYCYDLTIGDVENALAKAGIKYSKTEPGDSEYSYLAENDPDSQWAKAYDIQGGAILDKPTFLELVRSLGAFPSKCQSMGTLGGPANPIGIVPDVDFTVESQYVIVCFRCTPLPERAGKIMEQMDERDWDRIEKVMWNYDY